MPEEIWILGTAIVFTLLGMHFGQTTKKKEIGDLVEAVIDDLIRQGYIKNYKDSKGETELMKWWEDYPKEVDNKVDCGDMPTPDEIKEYLDAHRTK